MTAKEELTKEKVIEKMKKHKEVCTGVMVILGVAALISLGYGIGLLTITDSEIFDPDNVVDRTADQSDTEYIVSDSELKYIQRNGAIFALISILLFFLVIGLLILIPEKEEIEKLEEK